MNYLSHKPSTMTKNYLKEQVPKIVHDLQAAKGQWDRDVAQQHKHDVLLPSIRNSTNVTQMKKPLIAVLHVCHLSCCLYLSSDL